MKLWFVALFAAALLAGQNTDTKTAYLGQTWVGLLVSGSCNAGRTVATQEADRTVTDRVTTPAVDTAGTRGSSETANSTPAARGDIPQTGDIAIRGARKIKDPGWKQAQRQASSLDSACRVRSGTQQFALLLPDGRAVRFDDVANGKIAQQLANSGRTEGGKILRVQVIGKVENGKLALDEIQM